MAKNTKKTEVDDKTKELRQLVSKIKKACSDIDHLFLSGLERAKECGDLLIKAKALIIHGEFEQWMEKKFPKKSVRTLQDYKMIAEQWNNGWFAHQRKSKKGICTVEGALKLIRGIQRQKKQADKSAEFALYFDAKTGKGGWMKREDFPELKLTDDQVRHKQLKTECREWFISASTTLAHKLGVQEMLVLIMLFNRLDGILENDILAGFLKSMSVKTLESVYEEIGENRFRILDHEKKQQIYQAKMKEVLVPLCKKIPLPTTDYADELEKHEELFDYDYPWLPT